MRNVDALIDRCGDSLSALFTIRYPMYRDIIEPVYHNRGGIRGQQEAWSSTAIRIHKRMVEDIIGGAVLPPVVLGVVEEDMDFAQFQAMDEDQVQQWLREHAESLCLLDGVQRTTALIKAAEKSDLGDYQIRVELWISKRVNGLIYRMLVLNSVQTSRDIRRQLEGVFGAVLKQVQRNAPDIVISSKDGECRRGAGQYPSDDILECYLAFCARKEKIDTSERLSDAFVRLDFLDVTASYDSILLFADALSMMGRLDQCFARDAQAEEKKHSERIRSGIDIFGSQVARVGFIVATAIQMLGSPGAGQSRETLTANWQSHKDSLLVLLDRMNAMDDSEWSVFLALPVLSERLGTKRASNAGAYERAFFKGAFSALYEESDHLSSFEVCWNAY